MLSKLVVKYINFTCNNQGKRALLSVNNIIYVTIKYITFLNKLIYTFFNFNIFKIKINCYM